MNDAYARNFAPIVPVVPPRIPPTAARGSARNPIFRDLPISDQVYDHRSRDPNVNRPMITSRSSTQEPPSSATSSAEAPISSPAISSALPTPSETSNPAPPPIFMPLSLAAPVATQDITSSAPTPLVPPTVSSTLPISEQLPVAQHSTAPVAILAPAASNSSATSSMPPVDDLSYHRYLARKAAKKRSLAIPRQSAAAEAADFAEAQALAPSLFPLSLAPILPAPTAPTTAPDVLSSPPAADFSEDSRKRQRSYGSPYTPLPLSPDSSDFFDDDEDQPLLPSLSTLR